MDFIMAQIPACVLDYLDASETLLLKADFGHATLLMY
jgi:hypothetical protein